MNTMLHSQYSTVFQEQIPGLDLDSFARVGRLATITNAGEVYVDFIGNGHGPVPARIALSSDDSLKLQTQQIGTRLLLVFEDRTLTNPIIVGFIADRLLLRDRDKLEVSIDGRVLTIEGKEEVLLHCGKSSVSLKKNGKIIIKGVDLTSRATRGNRIRGGTVKIN